MHAADSRRTWPQRSPDVRTRDASDCRDEIKAIGSSHGAMVHARPSRIRRAICNLKTTRGPMKLWVTLEGRDEEVEFQTDGERLWRESAGRRLEADFHRLPDGEVYSLLVNGRSYEVRVVPGRETIDVTLHGATLPVEVRHPLEKMLQSVGRGPGAQGGETIAAPMPGLVVAIRVRRGERVEAGASVAVIEAMKMQNELIARRGGVVTDVLVAERTTVGAGQAIVKLGPEPA